jgi:hypothetical protein
MLQLLTEDVVFINISNEERSAEANGKKAFEQLAKQSANLFLSRQQVLESWQDDGNNVICRIRFSGKLTQTACSQLQCDETLNLLGTSVFSFTDNKICKIIDKS